MEQRTVEGVWFEDTGGSGVPILLVHGFPLTSRMWDAQLSDPALRSVARFIRADLPAFGKSARGAEHSIDAFARAMVGVLDSARIERAVWCGLSMGGYVVQRAIAHAPHRISGIVLCATRAEADNPEERARRMAAIEAITSQGRAPFLATMRARLLGPRAADDTVIVSSIDEMMAAASEEVLCSTLHALADRPDSVEALTRVEVPAMIIVGRDDVITPPQMSYAMQQKMKQGTQLEVVPDAGHMVNLEQSAAFNEKVARFIREHIQGGEA
jgi:3-oxoadipate enol-lactonase